MTRTSLIFSATFVALAQLAAAAHAATVLPYHNIIITASSGWQHGGGCRINCNGAQGGVTVTQTGTGAKVPTQIGPAPGTFGGVVRDHRGK
jgi:hypothetical protein